MKKQEDREEINFFYTQGRQISFYNIILINHRSIIFFDFWKNNKIKIFLLESVAIFKKDINFVPCVEIDKIGNG